MQYLSLPQSSVLRALQKVQRAYEAVGQKRVIVGALALMTLTALSYQLVFGAPAKAEGVALANDKVYLSPTTPIQVKEVVAPAAGVTVAQNGLVHLQGARIVRINGDTLTVSLAWGSANLFWTLRLSGATKFIPNGTDGGALSDFSQGDIVSATGMLDTNSQQPVVQVQYLRS